MSKFKTGDRVVVNHNYAGLEGETGSVFNDETDTGGYVSVRMDNPEVTETTPHLFVPSELELIEAEPTVTATADDLDAELKVIQTIIKAIQSIDDDCGYAQERVIRYVAKRYDVII